METEGVKLDFTKDAIDAIANFSARVNQQTEDIGARRLHTIMERLLDEISFEGPDLEPKQKSIDAKYVDQMLADTVKDQELRANFLDANRRAATALSDFANWLEKDKLPKATPDFALGEAKYQRWLTESELVDLTAEKILEIGLTKLKEEQKTFTDAAKIIDPNELPADVFKEIQKEHPSADKLIPDIAQNLDQIRGYVTEQGGHGGYRHRAGGR